MPASWMPDINVLIYAMRPHMAEHGWAFPWLRDRLEGGEPVVAHATVLAGALRVATRKGPNWEPTSLADAVGFLQALVDHPSCIELPATRSSWPILRRLCEQHAVTGPRVSDAFLAACAIDANCRFVTTDAGFENYAGLTWLHLPTGQLRTNPA